MFDGTDTLFDFQFSALGVSPEECFQLATRKRPMPEGGICAPVFAAPYFYDYETAAGRERGEADYRKKLREPISDRLREDLF